MKKVLLFVMSAMLLVACGPKEQQQLESIVFNPNKIDLIHGDAIMLQPVVSPKGAVTEFVWSSENSELVGVDNGGLITATKFINEKGATKIKVTDKLSGLSAECEVTVNNKHDLIKFYGFYGPWSEPGVVNTIRGRRDSMFIGNATEKVEVFVAKADFWVLADRAQIISAGEENVITIDRPDGSCLIFETGYFAYTTKDGTEGGELAGRVTLGHWRFSEWPYLANGEVDEMNVPLNAMEAGKFDDALYIDAVNGGYYNADEMQDLVFQGSWIYDPVTREDGSKAYSFDSYILEGSYFYVGDIDPAPGYEYSFAIDTLNLKTVANYFSFSEDNKINGYGPKRYDYTLAGGKDMGDYTPSTGVAPKHAPIRGNIVSEKQLRVSKNCFGTMNQAIFFSVGKENLLLQLK